MPFSQGQRNQRKSLYCIHRHHVPKIFLPGKVRQQRFRSDESRWSDSTLLEWPSLSGANHESGPLHVLWQLQGQVDDDHVYSDLCHLWNWSGSVSDLLGHRDRGLPARGSKEARDENQENSRASPCLEQLLTALTKPKAQNALSKIFCFINWLKVTRFLSITHIHWHVCCH